MTNRCWLAFHDCDGLSLLLAWNVALIWIFWLCCQLCYISVSKKQISLLYLSVVLRLCDTDVCTVEKMVLEGTAGAVKKVKSETHVSSNEQQQQSQAKSKQKSSSDSVASSRNSVDAGSKPVQVTHLSIGMSNNLFGFLLLFLKWFRIPALESYQRWSSWTKTGYSSNGWFSVCRVIALSLFQWFDTVHWVTGRASVSSLKSLLQGFWRSTQPSQSRRQVKQTTSSCGSDSLKWLWWMFLVTDSQLLWVIALCWLISFVSSESDLLPSNRQYLSYDACLEV